MRSYLSILFNSLDLFAYMHLIWFMNIKCGLFIGEKKFKFFNMHFCSDFAVNPCPPLCKVDLLLLQCIIIIPSKSTWKTTGIHFYLCIFLPLCAACLLGSVFTYRAFIISTGPREGANLFIKKSGIWRNGWEEEYCCFRCK